MTKNIHTLSKAPDPLRSGPLQSGKLFLTDGGIETCLIFHEGLQLRDFAAFELLATPEGRTHLRNYYSRHAAIARAAGTGFVFESPTWRASQDWGDRLGYSAAALDRLNRAAIQLMQELRGTQAHGIDTVISGCVGPRGDGYNPAFLMSAAEAQAYHQAQVTSFAEAGAEIVSAITMAYADEAIGIARAAAEEGVPAVISFTVETDGRLPTGQRLPDAIEQVDASCDVGPVYYMVNCAHPSHFEGVLDRDTGWISRIHGVRANASRMSHAELDNAEELDDGNPQEPGQDYRALKALLPNLTVMGGCCGTDHRHIEAICDACAA